MGGSQSLEGPNHHVVSRISQVATAFYPVSGRRCDNIPNSGDSGLNLIREVEGHTDLPYEQRPPTLASFLDLSQDIESGIIVVTERRLENFSQCYGFRKWQKKYQERDEGRAILCSDCLPRNCSQTLQMAVGLRNGTIEIISSSDFQLQRTLTASKIPSVSLTQLICPVENVIICGYSDGSIRSIFIESNRIASTIPRSEVMFEKVKSLDSSITDCRLNVETNSMKSSFEHPPCKVTALGFHQPKNWVVVGYNGYKKLTNETMDGQTALEDFSPPIALYSIEFANLLATFEPSDGTIIFANITRIPLSSTLDKSMNCTPLFLVTVTWTSFSIWQLPESFTPPSQQSFPRTPQRIHASDLCVRFSKTPIGELNSGRCVSAAIDSVDAVLFLLFEFGYVASVSLSLSSAPANSASHNLSEQRGSNDFSTGHYPLLSWGVSYSFYRLMQMDNGRNFQKHYGTWNENAEFPRIHCTYTSLRYDEKTQTLMVGDSHSLLHISTDVFGRYSATQILHELDRVSAMEQYQQQEKEEKDCFIPTIYVGQKNSNRVNSHNQEKQPSFFSSFLSSNVPKGNN